MDKEALGIGRARAYSPELEAVRGIAVALVVAMHLDGFVAPPFPSSALSPLRAVVRAPRLGVGLFFVLSAFLLSMPVLASAAGGRRIDVVEFARRRALRILPLYWTAVVVATLACARTASDLLHGLPYLGFLNALPHAAVPLDPYSGVWWSLATEAQFYVLLALAAVALRSSAGRIVLGIAAVAYVVAYGAYVRGVWRAPTVYATMALHSSVFGRGPLFLAGIGAAELYRRFGSRMRTALATNGWAAHGGADAVALLMLAGLAMHLHHVATLPPHLVNAPHTVQVHDVVDAILLAAMLLWLMTAPLHLRALVVNPVLTRLGILSYSIYLLHLPLLIGFVRHVARGVVTLGGGWSPLGFVLVGGYVAAVVAVAELTFRFIERPFLRRKARMRDAGDGSSRVVATIGAPSEADEGRAAGSGEDRRSGGR